MVLTPGISPISVMPALVAGIHVLTVSIHKEGVDGRDKPGHDAAVRGTRTNHPHTKPKPFRTSPVQAYNEPWPHTTTTTINTTAPNCRKRSCVCARLKQS